MPSYLAAGPSPSGLSRFARPAVFLAVLFALGTLLAAVRPALADWLVYKDGTRLQTAGGWETKGKLVVFSLPNGMLSTVRTEELDLDASREMTRLRQEASSKRQRAADDLEQAEPRPKAAIVLTDADVAHVNPAQFEDSSDAESDEPVVQKRDLEVTKWGQSEADADGIMIVGMLRNTSGRVSTSIELTAVAVGENNDVLLSQPATLDTTTLMPGQTTRFEALLRRVFTFRELKFETSSTDLEVADPDSAPQN